MKSITNQKNPITGVNPTLCESEKSIAKEVKIEELKSIRRIVVRQEIEFHFCDSSLFPNPEII